MECVNVVAPAQTIPKRSKRKRSKNRGMFWQGRLAMQLRQCGFWQFVLPSSEDGHFVR